VLTNLGLAIFNLIPVHPLDGAKVMARFLPDSWNRMLEENMSTISMALIFLMFVGGLRFLSYPIFWVLDGITLVAKSVVG
jgi:Zn-dependent protease